MLGSLGSTAQGLRAHRSLQGFVGDAKIEDVLAGLDSSKEMLVARVEEGNGGMGLDSGFHFARDDDCRTAMFDTVDGEWMFIIIAEAMNGIRASRKGLAADHEVVRDVYDEAVQVTSRGCGRQKSRDKREYGQAEGIPIHGLLLVRGVVRRSTIRGGLEHVAVGTALNQPQTRIHTLGLRKN